MLESERIHVADRAGKGVDRYISICIVVGRTGTQRQVLSSQGCTEVKIVDIWGLHAALWLVTQKMQNTRGLLFLSSPVRSAMSLV